MHVTASDWFYSSKASKHMIEASLDLAPGFLPFSLSNFPKGRGAEGLGTRLDPDSGLDRSWLASCPPRGIVRHTPATRRHVKSSKFKVQSLLITPYGNCILMRRDRAREHVVEGHVAMDAADQKLWNFQ